MWLIKMAWRNIWRNSRRTILTALALGIGVFLMSFMFAFLNAMNEKVVRTATIGRIGHAQLHHRDYAKTKDETKPITNIEQVLKLARESKGIKAASARAISVGLLAIADRSRGVQVIGVDAKHERQITVWQDRLKGAYISGPSQIMIGVKTAEKLDVSVDSKLLLTIANVYSGEPTTELVKVVGILSSGDESLDNGAAIVDLAMAQRMMGLKGSAHEVALMTTADAASEAQIDHFISPLATKQIVARPWHKINKMVAQAMAMQDKWMNIFIVIVFVLIAFGIVNTIAMSLLERTREFGVMRALGTEPGQLFGLILCEAGCLGLLGALPGAMLGLVLTLILSTKGINLSSASAYGVTFVEPLYLVPDVWGTLKVTVIFTLLTIVTALASARRTARLKPAQALRAS